jgi:translation initiation factor IF-2
MIEKQYRTKKKTMYFNIHDSWISKNLTINNDIKCNMQSEVTTEDEIILLINPLIINGGTDSYDLNERNKFKETKTMAFTIDSDKSVNPKLDKKNKKIIKNDENNKEAENIKSKLKLKKKIEGGYDDANTRKKQNTNSTKKSKRAARKRDSENDLSLERPEEIFLSNPISVQELAEKIYVSETEIIRTLFLDGIIVNINQVLDINTAINVGDKLGIKIIASEEEVKNTRNDFSNNVENTEKRPPIIAIMGHVDHGKTTLLDKIRQTQIAQKEAGGITQKIGAYEVDIDYRNEKKKLVFLDTPGHEAFSSMRYRGVQVTDIAVLVVAADDGVKPQTIETIKCIKEAKVPLIVAINKIDKDDANIENIKQELGTYNVIPDDWGGDTPMIPISAKEGTNMEELLEMIVLVSDMLDLRASSTGNAQGTVLEANLDKSKGAIATLLVQNGMLEVGDVIVTSQNMAKIRGMIDSNNTNITESMPSSPVLVWGLADVPNIGDRFEAFKDEKQAKVALQIRKNEDQDNQRNNGTSDKYSLLSSNIQAVINLVIKTDIQGSVEAIVSTINQINQEKVKVRILYASPGEITETDVDFADASKSTILAFNTTLAPGAKKVARHLGVNIKEYNVIYDLFDDIQNMVDDIIGPQYEEKNIGTAVVKAVFPLGKNYVAGSFVTEGKIIKGCHIKINRDQTQIYEGILSSLKQFKQDVREIEQDSECGIFIEEFDDWKEDDIISAFELIEKKKNK